MHAHPSCLPGTKASHSQKGVLRIFFLSSLKGGTASYLKVISEKKPLWLHALLGVLPKSVSRN
jgi:hypothetical protein